MQHTTQVTLVVENGKLHTKHSDISNRWMKMFFESNPLLLRISDEGDCESLRCAVDLLTGNVKHEVIDDSVVFEYPAGKAKAKKEVTK